MTLRISNLEERARRAVHHFWTTRERQAGSQKDRGIRDQGARSAVTGGAQMDGFIDLLAELIREAGMTDAAVFRKRAVELPGFFRPTKEWDLLVVADGQLLVVAEAKSQVGPSFGNNFNNRTEEAIGSAVDLWTAFREGVFNAKVRPWLGYIFLLEDCEKSRSPVSVQEPHFKVFKEFRGASYMKRYELLCRKLVRERCYEAAAFLTSKHGGAGRGSYEEPADDLTMKALTTSLVAHVSAYAANR